MATVEIPLSRGLSATVDAADACAVLAHKWHAVPARGTYYAARRVGSKTIYLHRALLGLVEAGRGVFADHRDGNGLNCTRKNLRACTPAQNNSNRQHRHARPSGLPVGVWCARGKFAARIVVNGVDHYLGVFETPDLAGIAYRDASRQFHGDYCPRAFQ
jgi:hypothetical protein